MKKIIGALVILVCTCLSAFAQKSGQKGDDSLLKCVCDTRNTQLLVKDGYVVLYSLKTHCPVYVGWKLTQDRVDGDTPRCKKFFPDPEIAEKDRVSPQDYAGSGWSRGHMCPAADNKDSWSRMEQSCLMTNICPQDMSLNSGRWNDLENKCRSLVRNGNTIYIICGPVFSSKKMRRIGGNIDIAIPDAFYKVMLIVSKTGKMRMEAYLMPNTPIDAKLATFATSVDNVEQTVGIDFFSTLDDKVEKDLEK